MTDDASQDPSRADQATTRRRSRTRPDRPAAATEPAVPDEPVRRSGTKAERDAERGLRGLIGAGPSQVGIVGAMRARDASRPTDDDMADAEKEIVIVRRHYVPTEAAPFDTTTDRPDRPAR